MAWHPAKEIGSDSGQSPYWQQLQSIYDEAMTLEPLPRGEWDYLQAHYILERRGERWSDVSEAAKALPGQLASLPLGLSEIDFLDLIVNYQRTRVLALIAPRGAGKTSFLHYVEAVIERSDFEAKPIFLIFGNLEMLDNLESFEAACHDLFTLMAGEVAHRAERLAESWRKALGRLSLDLRQCRSPSDGRECFRTFAGSLSPRELKRLVLVFDNLDQLHTRVITLVLDLARVIYLVSHIACIVCLRPNCWTGVARRGDARAFFNFEIALKPPSVKAWIAKVGERMADRVTAKLASGIPLVIAGQHISPEQLKNAMDRFVALLVNRPPQDDVLGLLQAICADDVRHLRILFRRMIANRAFPLQQLLNGEDRIDYHPVPTMLNGYNLLYCNDNYVPNLLWRSDAHESPDPLIFHRILRLLHREEPEILGSVIFHMEILDYPRDSTLSALETLYGPLLIRGTDQDKFDSDSPPTAIYLTEAGEYYRTQLLRNADYLLAAVLDVPLSHKRMHRSFESDPERTAQKSLFLERVDSLFEYTEEVASREKNQIAHLSSATTSPALRRVAGSLRHGGLLLSSLCHGLAVVVGRSWYSRYGIVRDTIDEYRPRFAALRETEKTLLAELSQIVQQRNTRVSLPDFAHHDTHGPMTIDIAGEGDNMIVNVKIDLERSDHTAVIFLDIETSNERALRTAIARPVNDTSTPAERRAVSAVARFDLVPHRHGGEIDKVHLRAYMSEVVGSREAFLAPEASNGRLKLKLYWLNNGPAVELGDLVSIADVTTTVQNILHDILGKTVGQQLRIEDLHAAGSKLARQLLNPAGMNVLATIARSLDRVVILSAESDVTIPFEWLRPVPLHDDVDPVGTLAEHCSVVRFPLHPIQYTVKARNRVLSQASLCTIGLPQAKEKPWRYATPCEFSDLRGICQDHNVLHIVAHCDEQTGRIMVKNGTKDLELSDDVFLAHPFCTPDHSIVLSVCKIGLLDHRRNIGRMLAEQFENAVWIPLVSIVESDAERLDMALAHYLQSQLKVCSLDHFFLDRRMQKEPVAHIYIRYGV